MYLRLYIVEYSWILGVVVACKSVDSMHKCHAKFWEDLFVWRQCVKISNTVHIMQKMEILLLTYFSSSFPLYSSFLFTPLFQCPSFKTQRMSLVLSLYINSIQPTSSLYDSTRIPYPFPRTYCCYQKEKWTSLCTFQEAMFFPNSESTGQIRPFTFRSSVVCSNQSIALIRRTDTKT